MGELESLETLHRRLESSRRGSMPSDGWTSHAAVLDRLAANIRVAEGRGWTSCAIERIRGERFSAWGVRPHGRDRHPVPDWSIEHAWPAAPAMS